MRNMTDLLRNHARAISMQVTDYRLKKAGITVSRGIGISRNIPKVAKLPLDLIKRLAG